MGTSRPSEENQEPREIWAEMSGLYRNEKLRGGKCLGWRGYWGWMRRAERRQDVSSLSHVSGTYYAERT